MIEIRWHGRGGQGSFTAAKLFGASAALYENKYALAFPSFGPERRGAPVLSFAKIDDKAITDRSEITKCDYIVVLDETLYNESFLQDLKPGGRLILNTANACAANEKIVATDASSIAMEVLGKPIGNTAMLGALIGVSGIIQLKSLLLGMQGFFKGNRLEQNTEVVKRAFKLGREAAVWTGRN